MAVNQFDLAEAYVDLKPKGRAELERAIGGVKRQATDLTQALDTASRNARRLLLVGGGVVGLSLKMASDAEEAGSKFRAVFKGQADDVEAWADTFGKSVGRSRLQLIPFLAQLQDTFVPLGFARDESADLSKQLTKLAVDLASFNNEAEPTTVDALTSALVGNHEAVRRFGIVITQGTLDQELLAMGFKKVTQGATEQQKVMARLAIIMRSTTDAQGDAERTSGSLANQLKALQGEWQELMVELGNAFIPAAKELIPLLKEIAQAIAEWVKEHKDSLPTMVKWGGTITAMIAFGPRLVRTLSTWGGWIKSLTTWTWGLVAANDALAVSSGKAALTMSARAAAGKVPGILPVARPLMRGAGGAAAGGAGATFALAAAGVAAMVAPVLLVSKRLAEQENQLKKNRDAYFREMQARNAATVKLNEERAARELEIKARSTNRIRSRFEGYLPEVPEETAAEAERNPSIRRSKEAIDVLERRRFALLEKAKTDVDYITAQTLERRGMAGATGYTEIGRELAQLEQTLVEMAAQFNQASEWEARQAEAATKSFENAWKQAVARGEQEGDRAISDIVPEMSREFAQTSAAGLQSLFQQRQNEFDRKMLEEAKKQNDGLGVLHKDVGELKGAILDNPGGFR